MTTNVTFRMSLVLMIVMYSGASAAEFPFQGTYGRTAEKWNGCEDAKIQREGDYFRFVGNKMFEAGEYVCEITNWQHQEGNTYLIRRNCGRGSRMTKMFHMRIDSKALTYEGVLYKRCTF